MLGEGIMAGMLVSPYPLPQHTQMYHVFITQERMLADSLTFRNNPDGYKVQLYMLSHCVRGFQIL